MTPEQIDALVAQLDEEQDRPEAFPSALLQAPLTARQAYFEQECVVEHTLLMHVCQQILAEVCVGNDGELYRRKGKLVLVMGPSRVGKTTLVHLLQQEMIRLEYQRLTENPALVPFASVSAAGAENGRFDWREYYATVLRSLGDPFIDPTRSIRPIRDLRGALIEAIHQRQPMAIIVDEAHHLAKHGNGRRLHLRSNGFAQAYREYDGSEPYSGGNV